MNTATKGQIPAVLIIDLEVDPKTDKPFKIGAFRPDSGLFFEKVFRGEKGFHTALCEMAHLTSGLKWLMGHNILRHDLKYLKSACYRYAVALAFGISAKSVSPTNQKP